MGWYLDGVVVMVVAAAAVTIAAKHTETQEESPPQFNIDIFTTKRNGNDE